MYFKEHCQGNEKKTQRRDKIFINYLSDKGLVSRIHKVHLQFKTKPQTTQLRNEQKMSSDISPKKIYKWPISTWKESQHH